LCTLYISLGIFYRKCTGANANDFTAHARLDPYSWRSAGIVGKLVSPTNPYNTWKPPLSAADRDLLRQGIAETKSLRPFAIFGDYYPLTPIDVDEPWAAYQMHRHATADG
jgi:hypothetical protein